MATHQYNTRYRDKQDKLFTFHGRTLQGYFDKQINSSSSSAPPSPSAASAAKAKTQKVRQLTYSALEQANKEAVLVNDLSLEPKTIGDDNLYLAPSKIPGAGMGLFTSIDIQKGTPVTEYKGVLCFDNSSSSSRKIHNNHMYCYGITNDRCINSQNKKRSNVSRYANDFAYMGRLSAKKLAPLRPANNNLVWKNYKYKTRVWMEARKDIPKDSELGICYGLSYWRFHGK